MLSEFETDTYFVQIQCGLETVYARPPGHGESIEDLEEELAERFGEGVLTKPCPDDVRPMYEWETEER